MAFFKDIPTTDWEKYEHYLRRLEEGELATHWVKNLGWPEDMVEQYQAICSRQCLANSRGNTRMSLFPRLLQLALLMYAEQHQALPHNVEEARQLFMRVWVRIPKKEYVANWVNTLVYHKILSVEGNLKGNFRLSFTSQAFLVGKFLVEATEYTEPIKQGNSNVFPQQEKKTPHCALKEFTAQLATSWN